MYGAIAIEYIDIQSKLLCLKCQSYFFYFISAYAVPSASVTIVSNQPNPIRPIGRNVTVTCTVELSSVVDVPLMANVQLMDPFGNILKKSTLQLLYRSIYRNATTVMLAAFGRNVSGSYTCTAAVTSSNIFLIDSGEQSATTRITVGKKMHEVIHV